MRPLDCRRPDHRMWQFSLQQEIAMIANPMSAHRRLSATFFTPLLLVALGSVPAAAQTVGNADAAAAAAQGGFGGDIDVTARRRAEHAQAVPTAIYTGSAAWWERLGKYG